MVAAYRQDQTDKAKEKGEIYKELYWIGLMVNQLATGVINAFGGKLSTTLGETYRKAIWEGEKLGNKKSPAERYVIHPHEFSQFHRPFDEGSAP